MPIALKDIQEIENITFNKYEEYICEKNTGYPDYKMIEESHYLNHPGDDGEIRSFGYGSLSHHPIKDMDIEESLITSPYITGSDYSGNTVELSNYEVFKEQFGELPGVYTVYGGYGTFSMAISVKWLLNPCNEEKADEILECLRDLSRYPVIDDDHLSNMECDKEYEYITEEWHYDLNRELKKQLGIEITVFDKDKLWTLYREWSERSNTYPDFEDNGWPYIDTKRLVKSHVGGDLTNLDIPHELIE